MSEPWCDIPKEKFEARVQFITECFEKWKRTFCQEMAKRDKKFLELENKIAWRTDKNGEQYTPIHFCTLYFYDYRVSAKHLMKDPENFLDRHKIVALTQQLILEHWPIAYSFDDKFSRGSTPPVHVRLLNAAFAYRFALDFLGSWNKELHEKVKKVPFDEDKLFQCLGSTKFDREHYKYLMLELTGPYPVFLISNLWFALEQWGLESLRSHN